jgi:hypothetical protein
MTQQEDENARAVASITTQSPDSPIAEKRKRKPTDSEDTSRKTKKRKISKEFVDSSEGAFSKVNSSGRVHFIESCFLHI